MLLDQRPQSVEFSDWVETEITDFFPILAHAHIQSILKLSYLVSFRTKKALLLVSHVSSSSDETEGGGLVGSGSSVQNLQCMSDLLFVHVHVPEGG